jgi:hypothetical protein
LLSLSGNSQLINFAELIDDKDTPLVEEGLQDGLWTYEFILKDSNGKTTTKTVPVMVDTSSPELVITSPVSGESLETSPYTVRGTVNDGDGRGVQTLAYSTNSSNGVDGTWTPISKAFSWKIDNLDVAAGGEGSRKIWIKASDGINPDTVKSVLFYYDVSVPDFTETLVNSTDTRYSNGTINFGGMVKDTNSSSPVQVLVKIDNAVAVSTGIVITDSDPGSGTTTHNNTTSWSYSLNTSLLSEGVHTIVFAAVDGAEKTRSVTRSVLVDREKPNVSLLELDGGGPETFTDWKGKSILPVSGAASDSGSGIALVEYSLDGVQWNALSTETSWAGNVPVVNGDNTIRSAQKTRLEIYPIR